jgi:peptide/nickel transport system ATP-binding protein
VSALLEVSGLRVDHGTEPIVDGVDFALERGEALGLAGESGCGKTTTALALMKLLPPALTQSGTVTLRPPDMDEPINIGKRTEAGMRLVRWRHVSLVFQGAMNSLDPVQRVDAQIAEAIRLHERASAKEVRTRIGELLTTVGLTPSLGRRYAHQLSGGQRQRMMIALALACHPSLVIADEPTTALDVVIQAQVLQLLEQLRQQLGLALILISHDMGVLADAPQHPYTKRLLDSLPVIGGTRQLAAPIPGGPPDPGEMPEGCRFRPRCPYAAERCFSDPALREVRPGQASACHYAPWTEWPPIGSATAGVAS